MSRAARLWSLRAKLSCQGVRGLCQEAGARGGPERVGYCGGKRYLLLGLRDLYESLSRECNYHQGSQESPLEILHLFYLFQKFLETCENRIKKQIEE